MGSKKDKKLGNAANKQPKPASVLSQTSVSNSPRGIGNASSSSSTTLSNTNYLVAFSSSTPTSSSSSSFSSSSAKDDSQIYYATVTQAADADTVRVYSVQSGQCTARWSSSSTTDRITAIEWLTHSLQQQSQPANQTHPQQQETTAVRGKKRRKSSSVPSQPSVGESVFKTTTATPVPQPSAPLLALGLSNGSILILHSTSSAIAYTIPSPVSTVRPVRALFFLAAPTASTAKPTPQLLWACYSGGKVSVWDVSKSSSKQTSPLASFTLPNLSDCSAIAVRYDQSQRQQQQQQRQPPFQILAASNSISAFSVSWSESTAPQSIVPTADVYTLASFSGHTTPIVKLAWTAPSPSETSSANPSKSDFFSVATNDRYINLWAFPPATDAASSNLNFDGRLVATAVMDESVLQSDIDTSGDTLSGLDAGGNLSLFSIGSANGSGAAADKKKRRKSGIITLSPSVTISSPSNVSAACATIVSKDTLWVASRTTRPSFEKIQYRDSDGSYIATVQLQTLSSASNLLSDGSEEKKATQRSAYAESSQSAIVSAQANGGYSAGGHLMKGNAAASEPTLAHRLQSLNVRSKEESRRQADGERDGGRPLSTGNKRIADATSLSQSLVQALHSSDIKLLEMCLSHTSATTIRATVKRLPNTLVVPLIDAIVQRLGKNKTGFGTGSGGVDAHRGKELMEWLRCVLMVHLSYLVTVPGLSLKFSSLYATLENRLLAHNQLLTLNGRLDLVISQLDLQNDPVLSMAPQAPARKPVVKKIRPPKPINTKSLATYREGQDGSDSSSSNEEEETDIIAVAGQNGVGAAEEGGEVEDLILGSEAEEEDMSDASDSEEEEATRPAPASIKMNGFLDVDAEESDDEEDDSDDGYGQNKGSKVNGIGNFPIHTLLNGKRGSKGAAIEDEDSEGDGGEEEDLDKYESDFINDDSESEGDESEDE